MLFASGFFLPPLAWFINLRFPSNPPAESIVIIRQAILGGIFVSLLAWLQMGRVLTLLLGGIILIVLIVIEFSCAFGNEAAGNQSKRLTKHG